MAITAETRKAIIELVVTAYDAAPGTTLLTELVAIVDAGGSLADVATNLTTRTEWTSKYPSFQTSGEFGSEWLGALVPEASAESIAAGVVVVEGLIAGGSTFAEIIIAAQGFLAALPVTDVAFGTSAGNFNNKVAVATYQTITLEEAGAGSLAGVTSDVATVTTANTATAAAVELVAGSTLTLTTGVDSLTGSADNDTINGVLQVATQAAATGTTTSPGDVVNGGAGIDTFNLSVAGDAGGTFTLQAVQLKNVENLLVTNFDINAADTTIDTALMTGVTKVGLGASSATGGTVFTGMTAIKDAQMANGSADLTLTYSAGTTGTADVQNLMLSAVSAGTFTANGLETVAVTTSLTANKLTNIAGSTLKAITVSGDQNFTMTGTNATKTIDASANTGKTSLVVSAAAASAGSTITLGSGDDTLDVGTSLNALDKIQGGEGTDTIKITAGGTVNGGATSPSTSEFIQSGGFEVIDMASTADVATLNIKDIAGVETVKAAANALTVVLDANASDVAKVTDSTAIGFTLNGTALLTGVTDSSGTSGEAAVLLQTKINNTAGFSAAVSGANITITNTSGSSERVDFALTAAHQAEDSQAYSDLTVSGVTDQSVDIYTADKVTVRLADPSGDADVMNVNLKSLLGDRSAVQTVTAIDVADTIETLNLNATGMKTGIGAAGIQKTVGTLTSDSSLTAMNISGSDKLTITTLTAAKLATIDASTATGDIALPGTSSLAQTITMGSGNDTLVMAGNLTGADVIDMGGNSVASATTGALGVDTVTTTGNVGSTVAAVAPQISNAEAVTFTGTANYIDGSSLTNVGLLAFANASGATTLTNMPAGTAIGLGVAAAESTHTYTVGLADATGTADALSLVYGATVNTGTSNTIVAPGFETLNVKAPALVAGNATHSLVLTNMPAATINVTGGHSSDTTALGTLNKATTTVAAGTNKGIVTFDASAGIAMTVDAVGSVLNVINLSTKADTVTLTGLLGVIAQDIDGGVTASAATADTLNVTLNSASSDFTNVGGFEVLNLTVPAALPVGFDATAKDGGLNAASVVNILGGNSNSTFTVTTAEFDTSRSAATALTVDASTFGGKIDLQFASDALDIFTTVKGGASAADAVDTIIAAGASASAGNNPTMTGVENLTITSTNGDTDAVINLGKATGLTKVTAIFDTAGGADQIEIDSLAAGVPVYVTGTNATDNLDVGVAGSTGASDALTIVGVANASGLNLDATGIETLTYSAQAAASSLDLAGVAPTLLSATTVNLTGPGAVTITALNAGTNVINAATLAGGLSVAASVRDSSTYTITGGVNNDTIAMENAADVIDGGLQAVGGVDTLIVNYSAVLGGITVDLTAADQIVTMDGTNNSAVQAGFESIDLRAFTNFGAVVTGTAGANTITGTLSADRINAGKGNDTIQINNAADINFAETISGGTGTDGIVMIAATTAIDDADFANMTSIESITLAAGTNTAVFGTNSQATGIVTITGGTGPDAISTAAMTAAHTIVGGSGADDITVATAGVSTVTVTAESAIVTVVTASLLDTGYFNITGFQVADDLIDFNGAVNGTTSGTAVQGTEGGDLADAAAIAADKTSFTTSVDLASDVIDGFIAGTTSLLALKGAAITAMWDASGTNTTTTSVQRATIAGLDAALDNASKVLAFTVDNEDTAIWYVQNQSAGAGGANTLDASELTLVGIIQGVLVSNANMATIAI